MVKCGPMTTTTTTTTTIESMNAFALRAALRAYRNEHYAACQSAGLGDSAAIGAYSTGELRAWCARLGITGNMVASATKEPSSAPASNDGDEDAGQLMARALAMLAPKNAPIDADKVREICDERIADAVASIAPRTVRVEVATGEKTKHVEGQHWLFPLIVKVISANVPLYLYGPAGTGKTTLCHAVAETLGLPFEFNSFGPGMSSAKLTGCKDATGAYHDVQLVRRYRDGGVWCADEIDRADGAILTEFNAPLANGAMSTPAGTIQRHADFRCVACANTAGTGANALFTSAMELDASTLDRFFFVSMPIDEALEERLCGIARTPQKVCEVASGGVVTADKWLAAVRAARAICEQRQMRHTISPRASIYGAKLCAQGVGVDWLVSGLLTRGLPEDEALAIETAARNAILA